MAVGRGRPLGFPSPKNATRPAACSRAVYGVAPYLAQHQYVRCSVGYGGSNKMRPGERFPSKSSFYFPVAAIQLFFIGEAGMRFNWFRRPKITTAKQELGARGEKAAAKYLRRHGYKVLLRGFRSRAGEIDIVARHKDWLVFVEVKTRKSEQFGVPSEAVNEETTPHHQGRARLPAAARLSAGQVPVRHRRSAHAQRRQETRRSPPHPKCLRPERAVHLLTMVGHDSVNDMRAGRRVRHGWRITAGCFARGGWRSRCGGRRFQFGVGPLRHSTPGSAWQERSRPHWEPPR